MGFRFNKANPEWACRVAELIEFKEQHGHCQVKRRDGSLGRWVDNLRRRYKFLNRSDMSADLRMRLEELDAIGFVWDVKRKSGTRPKGAKASQGHAGKLWNV